MHPIQALLEDEAIRSYSGRGMGGKNCLGIVVACEGDPMAYVASTIMTLMLEGGWEMEDMDQVAEAMKGAKRDSMGLDHIIYFPSVKYVDEDS